MDNEIYFDSAATTRVDEDCARLALDVMCDFYGNPSSVHAKGLEAEHILKTAHRLVTDSLGYDSREGSLIFTSGGTEASNTAIFGTYATLCKRGDNIIISDSEHPSVEKCAQDLEKLGVRVSRIPTKGGVLDLDFAEKAMNDKTILISCMLVNNETGAVYDVKALRRLRDEKAKKAYLHMDAVQGFTKVSSPLSSIGADLISLSGHKIHAPKGVGALFIKKGVNLPPRAIGGGQEGAMRSGTEGLPAIAAFGLASEKAANDKVQRLSLLDELNRSARENIEKYCPYAVINSKEDFAKHILSVSIPGIRSEIMLRYLSEKGIYVSAGSACSSKHADNRVLTAFGLDDKTADSTIRISFSKYNTVEETEILARAINDGNDNLIHTLK